MIGNGARIVSRQLRQAVQSNSAASRLAVRLPSSSAPIARSSYATQAGQPMPPPPPPSSSRSNKPSDSTPSSSSSAAASKGLGDTVEPSSGGMPIDPADPPVPPNPASMGAATPSSQQGSKSTDIKPVSSLASDYLDMTEIPAERTGARSTASGKRPMSSIERKRRNLGRAFLALTAVGVGIYAWHEGRDWDSEKEKQRLRKYMDSEAEADGLAGRWQRCQARFRDTADFFNKPAWEPLIPEPLPPPHQKPYTLVLSLDDLLIHSSWDREHGWRTAKRPGVDYFLSYLSQFYEIVLFTSQPPYTAMPIVEKLDPHMLYILYKLYKDSTVYHKKEIVKDLSYLGRDLSKVIMLDTDPKHAMCQPENAYIMKPWDGSRDDTDLVGMIPFLEALFVYQVPDVRKVLPNYADKHIPTVWAEVEAEQKRQLIAEWEANQASRKGKLGGGIASAFGLGSSKSATTSKDAPPKTQLEQQRELFQKAYLEEQKWWADNKAALEKAMEEDRERQKKEMPGTVLGMFNTWFGVPPPPGTEPGRGNPQAGPGPVASK